jgi:hypothetical protein
MRIPGILILFSLSCVAALNGADKDPFLGKWKLNWEKSNSSDPKPKSATRTYKQSGSSVRVSEVWVDQDGKSSKLDYVAKYDGKDHPVRTAKGRTVAFTKSDPRTVEGVSKTNGSFVSAFKRSVSDDGKTLTIEIKDGPTAPPAKVLVYDKIK